MRIALRTILILLALLLALGVALPWLANPLARIGLRAVGIEWLALDEVRLGLGTIELQGLQIGPDDDHHVSQVRLDYRLGDVLEGRLRSVEIEGLQLKARLTPSGLELAGFEGGQGDDGAGLALPFLPERFELRDSHLELETSMGELLLPLAAELRTHQREIEFSLAIEAARLEAGPGTLSADLRLRGTAPLDLAAAADELRANGTLEFDADQLDLPGLAGGIGTTGEIGLQVADGRLTADLEDAELIVDNLDPRLAELAAALPPPWQIRLGGDQRPLQLVGHLDPSELRLEIDGDLAMTTSGPTATMSMTADAVLDDAGRLKSLAPSRAVIELNELEWQQNTVETSRIEIVANSRDTAIEGRIDVDMAGHGSPTTDVSLAGLSLQQSFDVVLNDTSLEVSAPAIGRFHLENIAAPNGIRSGPIDLELEPGVAPLLAAEFEAGAMAGWQVAVGASLAPFATTVGDDALQILSSAGELSFELSGDGGHLTNGRIGVADGRLELPQHALTLGGITAKIPLGPDGLADASTIAIERIAHGATPPWFTPASLQASLQPTADRIAFQTRLAAGVGTFELNVDGGHNWSDNTGTAMVEVAPVTFAPNGLQPEDLAPVVGDVLQDVAGRLALDGTIGWRPDDVGADLALLIEDGGFAIGPARVVAINGVIGLDRLWPPTTPPGQQLAVGLLDLGLPLTNGLVSFQLTSDERLAVEELRWQLAGGSVNAEPFSIGSGVVGLDMTLHAAGLDLDQVFALTRLEGLSGEGTIDGVLPISLHGTEAVIDGGELAAEGPGIVRYRAAEGPAALATGGASVDLLLQALENFRYDALSITLDGQTNAAMDIGLHISGANPDLYDGHPIELNLDLEGELANILRSGLASYQIPDRIRERMQGFGP